MANCCGIKRIYKGDSFDLRIPEVKSEEDFQLVLFTSPDFGVNVLYEDIEEIDDMWVAHIDAHLCDELQEGVLKFRLQYTYEGDTDVIERDTCYILKNASGEQSIRYVKSDSTYMIWTGTEEEFQSIEPKEDNVLYLVKED